MIITKATKSRDVVLQSLKLFHHEQPDLILLAIESDVYAAHSLTNVLQKGTRFPVLMVLTERVEDDMLADIADIQQHIHEVCTLPFNGSAEGAEHNFFGSVYSPKSFIKRVLSLCNRFRSAQMAFEDIVMSSGDVRQMMKDPAANKGDFLSKVAHSSKYSREPNMGKQTSEKKRKPGLNLALTGAKRQEKLNELQKHVDVHQKLFSFAKKRKSSVDESMLKRVQLFGMLRWHAKHHAVASDNEKDKNPSRRISQSIIEKLKVAAHDTRKSVKLRQPIEAPRDVLQGDFMSTEMPPSSVAAPDAVTRRAIGSMMREDYRTAVEQFSKAIIMDPEHFHALFFRSKCYFTVGRYRYALADMKKCQKLRPHLIEVHINLALIRVNCHQLRKAVKEINLAAKIDPECSFVYRLRALVKRRVLKGDYESALQDYIELRQLTDRLEYGTAKAHILLHERRHDNPLDRKQYNKIVEKAVSAEGLLDRHLTPLQKALVVEPGRRTKTHIALIDVCLSNYRMLYNLSDKARLKLCQEVIYETHEPGTFIYNAGTVPTAFFLVVSGELDVKLSLNGTMRRVNILTEGDSFGQLALLENRTHTSSVYVREPSEIIRIDVDAFENFSIAPILLEEFKLKQKFLRLSGIFKTPEGEHFPEKFIGTAAKYSSIKQYNRGEKIVAQGEQSRYLYILIHGIIHVRQRIDELGKLLRERKQAQHALDKYETNYVYHHEMSFQQSSVRNPTTSEEDKAHAHLKMLQTK
eukprot:g5203.t1